MLILKGVGGKYKQLIYIHIHTAFKKSIEIFFLFFFYIRKVQLG